MLWCKGNTIYVERCYNEQQISCLKWTSPGVKPHFFFLSINVFGCAFKHGKLCAIRVNVSL